MLVNYVSEGSLNQVEDPTNRGIVGKALMPYIKNVGALKRERWLSDNNLMTFQNIRILCVDDSSYNLIVLKELFANMAHV